MMPETNSGAEQLQTCVFNFNFIVLLHFWNVILGKIDRVQKRLQNPTINFKEAATDIESLEQEFVRLRNDLSQVAVENTKTKCTAWGIEMDRRIKRRRKMPGKLARDAGLLSEEEIVRVMKSVFDRLQQEMSTRFLRLKDLNTKFGFLLDVKTLLSDTDVDAIRRNCTDFENFYDTDINGHELFTEIGDCRMLLSNRNEVLPETPLDLLGFIVFYGDNIFPNLRISLQILLTISVSIASCERSFSKLKLILAYLRASVGQDRLNDLALLSVERETLEKTDFDCFITQHVCGLKKSIVFKRYVEPIERQIRMLTVVFLGTIFIQLRHVAAASHESANLLSSRGEYGIPESSDCNISLYKSSISRFRHDVWYNEWNFVSLHLTFPDRIEVQGTRDVVGPLVWIWTFFGNKGALEFLSWPIEFGIWSMGFLNAYSGDLPNFQLNVTGNCSNLVVGEDETNYAISIALKEAVDEMIGLSEMYGPSFWCFKTRIFINPDFIYYMCLHMVCPVEALKYQCCSNFFNTKTLKRDVSCPGKGKNGLTFTYDVLWWVFPTVLAVLLFAFSPLLLMNMACRVCELTESFNVKGTASDKSYEEISDEVGNKSENDEELVFYSEQKAVTIFSSFFQPIGRRLMGHGRKVSIVFRVLVPIFSLSIVVLQIILDWISLRDFVIEGVQKGVPMGFRSMIAGFDDSKRNFLRFVGGPYIACGLYLFITCLFLALPPDLSLFLERGLKNTHDVPSSALQFDFRSIERLGSVSFCNRNGYRKIYKLFLAQFFMLINVQFWKEAIEMQRQRWNHVDVQRRYILFLPYVLICVMELIACFLYYGLPILPFTVTVIRAYCGHLLKLVKNYRLAIFRYIGFVLLLIVTAAVLFFVYMFCTIFLDACLFFSRVCIFTYTGIIVYPKISYGYLIFFFTIFYYLWDSVKEYSESYQRLLKVVIRVCKALEKAERGQRLVVSQNGTEGISRNIFEHVIERYCPRRKQVFVSLLKVIIIIVILGLSVNLLMKTDQFKELHVVMHVGTALFICAFPKILGSMCSSSDRRMKSKRRVQKVMKTVRDYLGYIPANYECGDEVDDSDTPLLRHPLVPVRHDYLPLNFGNADSHE